MSKAIVSGKIINDGFADMKIAPEIISVGLGIRAYNIIIGTDILINAGQFIKPVLKLPRVIIVSDDNVAPLHLEILTRSLANHDILYDSIILPAGEPTKSFDSLTALINDIMTLGIERKSTLIALGGGVVGDLTGFAAAILLRGIDFIQIPTSLLAQVDSSVGGKTGINIATGKNLVGAFHQPKLVLADINSLNTLTKRDFLAGYAEMVKYGAINKPDFFAWLEKHGEDMINGDVQARIHGVKVSCMAKAEIVALDETEQNMRALLNLGHTFGHSLETAVGYGSKLVHGEAVSIGMVMAFDLSVMLGLCVAENAVRLRRHLVKMGLPVSPIDIAGITWNADDLIDIMGKDKKVSQGMMTFILAKSIGNSFVTNDVPIDILRQCVVDSIKNGGD